MTCCCSSTWSLRNSISCSSLVRLRSVRDVWRFREAWADSFSFCSQRERSHVQERQGQPWTGLRAQGANDASWQPPGHQAGAAAKLKPAKDALCLELRKVAGRWEVRYSHSSDHTLTPGSAAARRNGLDSPSLSPLGSEMGGCAARQTNLRPPSNLLWPESSCAAGGGMPSCTAHRAGAGVTSQPWEQPLLPLLVGREHGD